MEYRFADLSEKDDIFRLYRSVIGEEGCTWSEDYPSMEILEDDLAKGNILCAYEDGALAGAISIDSDPLTDALDCWSEALSPSAELARVVTARDYRCRGVAKEMFRRINEELKQRGFRSSHYLVSPDNTAAVRAYGKLSYRRCGECDLYGHHWDCYEKEL